MLNKEVLSMQEAILVRRWTGTTMVLVQYAFQIYTQRQPGMKMQIK